MQTGKTALHMAAEGAQLAAARTLLDAGAPLEAPDASGCTALHMAVEQGLTEVARLLLNAGANHAATNKVGGLGEVPGACPWRFVSDGTCGW